MEKALAIFSFLSLYAVLYTINDNVPDPYMDEVFHVPQAQKYCDNEFGYWDDKITTPPGLYLSSLAFVAFLSRIFAISKSDLCSVSLLRLTNTLFGFLLLPVLKGVIEATVNLQTLTIVGALPSSSSSSSTPSTSQTKESSSSAQRSSSPVRRKLPNDGLIDLKPEDRRKYVFYNAFVIWWFPVSWWFYFMYYTDSGSTLSVLLMYWLALKEWRWTSSLFGAISVFFRQTNIVWIFFTIGISIVRHVIQRESLTLHKKEKPVSDWMSVATYSESFNFLRVFFARYLSSSLIHIVLPYSWVIFGFISFLKWNGGVVLGDKSNHVAMIHVPQFYYFLCFTVGFGAPTLTSFRETSAYIVFSIRKLRSRKGFMFMTVFFSLMFLTIYQFTYQHPFLLSDNRHYTFYVWKNVYRRHTLIKYLLIPVYFASGWYIYRRLAKYVTPIHISLYFISVALTIIPSPLLEFRYFIIPYLLYRVLTPTKSIWRLMLEWVMYMAINGLTIWIFLEKTFAWEGETTLMRFMW
ncbi:dol-P-Glc:Glc(2)Man(9)GlcNAc(2)-PP-Dol alpha-1,2-glucosyltransferase-like protein [Paraphysoderma sedebokerense]|nr:dol-P-Glc:Glc(2)Man(9)GlcNAc(2)-PP-Dol alpha-1,2-glucosyltransferase-like protein [Paraphysoderma sedebokerense]